MRVKTVAATILASALALSFLPEDASAQIPPSVNRDPNWDTVSTVSMAIGVSSVILMPRVYYASPEATVGWKARWHISSLAPTMSMVGLTLLVDGPIRDALQEVKVGCTVDQTLIGAENSGCESFGMPSTHAFASWGATGVGTGIFLVDTFEHSDGEISVPSFIGNIGLPLAASIMTSAARSADGSGTGPESTEQVLAGAIPGFAVGMLIGMGYGFLQEPDCGYGGNLFCW